MSNKPDNNKLLLILVRVAKQFVALAEAEIKKEKITRPH